MSDDKTTSVQSIMTPLPLEIASPLTNLRDITNQMKEKGAIRRSKRERSNRQEILVVQLLNQLELLLKEILSEECYGGMSQ